MATSLYTPKAPPPHLVKRLEENPLDHEAWQEYLQARQDDHDTLATQALSVIANGIRAITEPGSGGQEGSQLRLADKLDTDELKLFAAAAKEYHDSGRLNALGNLYLRRLRRPDLAKRHFKQASHLGSSNTETYKKMLAKCEEAEKAELSGPPLEFSGMTTCQRCKPALTSFFTRSGKLVPPADLALINDDPAAGAPPLDANDPRNVDQLIDEALALTDQGQAAQAAQAAALMNHVHQMGLPESLVSDVCDVWTSIGAIYFGQRDMPRAARAYDQACRLLPNCMESWFNLGTSLHYAGNFEHSQRCYEYADKLEPDHAKVLCNLGALYFQLDNLAAAEHCLRRSVSRKPDYVRAWQNLGTVLGARGKMKQACEALNTALTLQPDNAETSFKIAMIYYDQDNIEAARQAFGSCLSKGVCQGYAWLYLSLIASREGNLEKAIQQCQQGLNADPQNEVGWIALNEIGLACIDAGNFVEGVELLKQASVVNPNQPVISLNLGVAYFNYGDMQEARKFLAHAASQDQELASAWHAIGMIEANSGNVEKAIEAFRTVTNLDPRDPRGWYDLGVGLERNLNFNESRSAIGKAMQLSQAMRLKTGAFEKAQEELKESGLPIGTKTSRIIPSR